GAGLPEVLVHVEQDLVFRPKSLHLGDEALHLAERGVTRLERRILSLPVTDQELVGLRVSLVDVPPGLTLRVTGPQPVVGADRCAVERAHLICSEYAPLVA